MLNFPPWGFHEFNFHNNRWRFEEYLVGSYGDKIMFNDLPPSAKSAKVVTSLGGTIVADSGEVVEVCSSPGEVANSPNAGHQYLLQKYSDAEIEYSDSLDQDHERWHSNHMVWNTISLNAPDQLRQRVAWALSSIFVVSENSIDRGEHVESWATYYDIFVSNAFNDFKTILKSVAFNPLMAEMLTFKGSKSLAYQVERNGGDFAVKRIFLFYDCRYCPTKFMTPAFLSLFSSSLSRRELCSRDHAAFQHRTLYAQRRWDKSN